MALSSSVISARVPQQENLILSQDCPMVSCQILEQLRQKLKRKWHEATEANEWQDKLKEDLLAKHGLPNPFLLQMQEHVQAASSLSMREKQIMQDKKDMEMEEWIIDPDKLTEREDHFTTEHYCKKLTDFLRMVSNLTCDFKSSLEAGGLKLFVTTVASVEFKSAAFSTFSPLSMSKSIMLSISTWKKISFATWETVAAQIDEGSFGLTASSFIPVEVHADDEKIKSQNFDVFIFSKCTGDYVELKTPQYFLEKLAAHVALAEFMKP
ncbi:hypothetical protein P5673_003886 [Acropora cervicornis]|uniref:Uncharacterized protein n=1 Tax=Acropora cervicornis TaxID=6130 RepID=A0AAD9VEA8_ACRCE|nr:hypothetical protein P5673_003886 [Acropora cervicornis]